jgi:protein-disulfide isomerase
MLHPVRFRRMAYSVLRIQKSNRQYAIRNTPYLFLFLTLLLLLLAACGPAVSSDQPGATAGEGETILNDAGFSGEQDVAQPAGNGEVAAPSTPLVFIQPAGSETDTNGIPVGFTEDGRPYRGNPDAAVVIEEYSDYQCPYCARFTSQTLPSLMQNQINNGETVVIFYDFPLTSIHPQSAAAANAARCAGEQGAAAYWAMHDALFANFGRWSDDNANEQFSLYAEEIGLEMESFDACVAADKYAEAVRADIANGQARGVGSTPHFFINNQGLVGAQPLAVFNQAIATIQGGGDIASNQQQPAAAPTPASFTADFAGEMGSADAPVTIIEFTDYQCPYCQRHSLDTLPVVIQEMIEAGRVRYILKDFPLDNIHPDARRGAVAARCAGEQNAYWEMHDAIFTGQAEWAGQGDAANQTFIGYAGNLGLDREEFGSCLSSGRYDAAIQANLNEGQALGVSGTPYFFIQGYPLNGARPIEHFQIAVSLAEEGRLAEAFAPQPTAVPPAAQVEVPIGDAYSIGDPDAPITIVEYTDFQCPFCGRHYLQTYPLILQNYVETGQVRYVFKDFTPTFNNPAYHPNAIIAAEAARCAGDQDQYVEMHDQLFANQGEWSEEDDPKPLFASYAAELGLDSDEFNECLTTHKHLEAIQANFQEGVQLGVTGTPTFFINGYRFVGANPYQAFDQAFQDVLANN